jgi:uncharacterized protein YgbK (DUF1537 family)
VDIPWLVTADDRTGAFEVAALIARRQRPTLLTVAAADSDSSGVVDVQTRHLSARCAAEQVEVAHRRYAAVRGHKIDSLLRGNWDAEIAALAHAGHRVLVVPAWPEVGRTCEDGRVRVDGRSLADVAGDDPRSRFRGDQPADLLGAHGVRVASVSQQMVGEWLAHGEAVAVCDAHDEADLGRIARAAAGSPRPVVVAGPAGPVAAAVRCALGHVHDHSKPAEVPAIRGPVLVVRGSVHAIAVAQAQAVSSLGHAAIDVVGIDPGLSGVRSADELLATLAATVAAARHRRRYATIIVIGGDSAAAVLGDAPRMVGGTVASGMPWSVGAHEVGPLVVTKAGSFGHETSLLQLVAKVAVND